MKTPYSRSALLCLPVLVCALGLTTVSDSAAGAADAALDRHAAEYLGLVADLAAISPESVDFQIADPLGLTRSRATSLTAIEARSSALAGHLRAAYGASGDSRARAERLAAQVNAIAGRTAQLNGERLSFDDELARLFALSDERIERLREGDSSRVLTELGRHLPGDGSLSQRLAVYQRRFVVTRGQLDSVVAASIEACRNQTRRFLALPDGEGLAVEYVAERPWSAYSVYRGGYQSIVQINRAVPLTVGQVLNLACHEGYPGHHVYNILRDQRFMRERGWLEAGALPVFSPEGFRAEAAASAAAEIAFSHDERVSVFQRVLFPLTALDPREAERYAQVCDLIDRLAGDTTAVVLEYLAGEMAAPDAVRALRRRSLMEHPEALLAYVDRYRGYSLAYTWGRDRLLAGLGDPPALNERADYLAWLMTSSEWDLGRQE
jgi:hypothetical protein